MQPLQFFLAGVEAREFEQCLDQFPHPLRRALAGLYGFLVTRGVALAVQSSLRLCQNDGDGRAQFVRGVGGELFLLRERGFQPREGGIQNGGELAEFAFGLGDVDALRQISGGNFHGGGADVFDGAQRARNKPKAARESEK